MKRMEFRIAYILGVNFDEELGNKVVFADDLEQALFKGGYSLREEPDGKPVRLLSVIKHATPETVYFKANPNASRRAESLSVSKYPTAFYGGGISDIVTGINPTGKGPEHG